MQVHHRLHHIIRFFLATASQLLPFSARSVRRWTQLYLLPPLPGFIQLLSFSLLIISLVHFRVQLSANSKQVTWRSVCLVERREPSLGFRLPGTCQSVQPPHTGLRLGYFFLWFWSCDTFLQRQPRASTKHAYRQPPRYQLEHHLRGRVEEELKKGGGKGKKN